MIQKTTNEIKRLLTDSKLDFDKVVNEALNSYLPNLYEICPFTEDVCKGKVCIECEVFKNR